MPAESKTPRVRSAIADVERSIATAAATWEKAMGGPFGFVIFDLTSRFAVAIADQYIPPPVRAMFDHVEFFGTVVSLTDLQRIATKHCPAAETSAWCATTVADGHVPCLFVSEQGFLHEKITRIACTAPGGSA